MGHTKQHNMIKRLQLLFVAIILISSGYAQTFYGSDANKIVNGATEIHKNINSKQIDYIRLNESNMVSINNVQEWLIRTFKLPDNVSLTEINRINAGENETHIRYKLSVNNVNIHDGMFIIHTKGNMVYAMNGIIQKKALLSYNASISESEALKYATNKINAKSYKWELAEEEKFIKNYENNNEATYFPKARFEIIRNKTNNEYRLAYIFDIYAHNPMSRQDVYVDANNGDILFINKKIHHTDVTGSATTKYSGVKSIITDSHSGSYRLRESGRGLGIETYDLNNSTSYGSAVDFTDSDNNWNNVNAQQDEIATDAHWGMEMTYDYYYSKHNRNSIDGNGYKLKSYVHFDNSYANAFWNGQFMTFGDGNSSMNPLVALDIVGHEISHGLTSNTANLDYQDESGAMNEAFSDIFGTAIEFFAKPNAANWLMGENIGIVMRSMSNPKSKGDPDTYLGVNYYIGTADNGGVHTNSGVLNYIFYMMSDGKVGTNDNGDAYNVTGLGIDTASKIAFRTLTVYLTNTSQYADARFYFIKAAVDLYGPCSSPVKTTTDAFYAAGIGSQYQAGVQADFDASIKSFCQPTANVSFTNLSNNGLNFIWDFGDGSSSTDVNPNHAYINYGNYVVKLITDGGSCGADTIIKDNFISVDTANPCVTFMPGSGNQTITGCSGVLLDDGGSANYSDNMNVTTTISPLGATSIALTFTSFDFEVGFDYLKIYDGPSSSSPIIGSYDGTTLPNGGTITANSGSITIVQETDQMVNKAGFVASWQCTFAAVAPISSFIADDTANCTGLVNFTNTCQNGPTSYTWDFGDGTTSSYPNPNHTYTQNGVYTVSLLTSNPYGSNQITKTNFITINKPNTPYSNSIANCSPGSYQLTAGGNGLIKWYNSQFAINATDTGHVFTTPNLSQTTSYWVENNISKAPKNGGKTAVASNGGILSYEQGLIFDVYKNSILKTVKVYATSAGSRTIKLQNSGGVTLQSRNVTVSTGWNTVTLDFNLPIATNLKIVSKNLWRNNSGVSYPYDIPSILSIKKSSASSGSLGYYYYFYEWVVQEESCSSDRVKVTAFINNAAPVASFTEVNNDPYVNFNNTTTNIGISHWDFGDQLVSDNANPQHLYITNGTFDVKLRVNNGCGVDSITKTITIGNATSIDEANKDEISKLYPNPNNGEFTLEINTKIDYSKFEIYNSLGDLILSSDINTNDKTIKVNISTYSPGMYLIVLKSEGINSNIKFIKK